MKYLILLIPLLLSCRTNEKTPDCGVYKNVYDDNVVVRRLPINLYFHESVTDLTVESTVLAVNEIENIAGVNIFNVHYGKIYGDYHIDHTEDGLYTVYEIHKDYPRNKIEQAVTRVRHDYSQIYEADIFLNNDVYNFKNVITPCNDFDVHLESLMLHELMHVIGFQHQTGDSVMRNTLPNCAVRNKLTQMDINNLKCLYGN